MNGKVYLRKFIILKVIIKKNENKKIIYCKKLNISKENKNAVLPKTLYRGKLAIFLLSNNHQLDLNIFNDTSLR